MMKFRQTIVLLAFAVVLSGPAFAQAVAAGLPNAADIGKDQAQQLLKEVSISKFEDAAFWETAMPLDMGVVAGKRLAGSPTGKQPIPEETSLGIKEEDKYVLGVKVSFFHRGDSFFAIHPATPLAIEGIVKTLSVWVVGRNFNHTLKVVFEDYAGQQKILTMGTLNFVGWKKLTVAIPPNIQQSEYHYGYRNGIRITGFQVDTDPLDSYGVYYLYMDDLRAVTDLFGESKRDVDDMSDGW
jgi:hypothetical protein